MKHPNNLKLVKLAISSRESVDSAVEAATPLLPNGLDYLVNNAWENPQPTTSFEALYRIKPHPGLGPRRSGNLGRGFHPCSSQRTWEGVRFASGSMAARAYVDMEYILQYRDQGGYPWLYGAHRDGERLYQWKDGWSNNS
ncbi:hypothetical protein BJ912DRAFT_923328 [Pholiota molesta]|nr:hypothetical protein BJ912DRAFT_923328 [Pholiota molesta]